MSSLSIWTKVIPYTLFLSLPPPSFPLFFSHSFFFFLFFFYFFFVFPSSLFLSYSINSWYLGWNCQQERTKYHRRKGLDNRQSLPVLLSNSISKLQISSSCLQYVTCFLHPKKKKKKKKKKIKKKKKSFPKHQTPTMPLTKELLCASTISSLLNSPDVWISGSLAQNYPARNQKKTPGVFLNSEPCQES